MCACACVAEREREREQDGEGGRRSGEVTAEHGEQLVRSESSDRGQASRSFPSGANVLKDTGRSYIWRGEGWGGQEGNG